MYLSLTPVFSTACRKIGLKLNQSRWDDGVLTESEFLLYRKHRIPLAYDCAQIGWVVNADDRFLSTQLLYSYKVNPKTLLFLGYTDSGLEDENMDLIKTNKAVFAKFSYAFKR